MKKLYYLIIFISLLFLLENCSQTSTVQNEQGEETPAANDELYKPDINIFVKKVYSWVDLMPGSESRFHITGDLVIPESGDYDLNRVELKLIKIYQNGSEIYFINPTVQIDKENEAINVKELLFSTISGLSIDMRLDMEKPVDVEYVFEENGESFLYKQYNVKINKVY